MLQRVPANPGVWQTLRPSRALAEPSLALRSVLIGCRAASAAAAAAGAPPLATSASLASSASNAFEAQCSSASGRRPHARASASQPRSQFSQVSQVADCLARGCKGVGRPGSSRSSSATMLGSETLPHAGSSVERDPTEDVVCSPRWDLVDPELVSWVDSTVEELWEGERRRAFFCFCKVSKACCSHCGTGGGGGGRCNWTRSWILS
mmetsp:Transcript_1033/g.3518  ORF Transcript_1033/g.3518 Transcript_1033/m.3518 type:complete len:207 (-) Transcript_1033:222-842(-)